MFIQTAKDLPQGAEQIRQLALRMPEKERISLLQKLQALQQSAINEDSLMSGGPADNKIRSLLGNDAEIVSKLLIGVNGAFPKGSRPQALLGSRPQAPERSYEGLREQLTGSRHGNIDPGDRNVFQQAMLALFAPKEPADASATNVPSRGPRAFASAPRGGAEPSNPLATIGPSKASVSGIIPKLLAGYRSMPGWAQVGIPAAALGAGGLGAWLGSRKLKEDKDKNKEKEAMATNMLDVIDAHFEKVGQPAVQDVAESFQQLPPATIAKMKMLGILAGLLGTSGVGAGIGGGAGMLAGLSRGNIPEGLGRGLMRGGAAGGGVGLGGMLGTTLGGLVGHPGAGGLLGAGAGGAAGYIGAGKLMGKPVGGKEKQGAQRKIKRACSSTGKKKPRVVRTRVQTMKMAAEALFGKYAQGPAGTNVGGALGVPTKYESAVMQSAVKGIRPANSSPQLSLTDRQQRNRMPQAQRDVLRQNAPGVVPVRGVNPNTGAPAAATQPPAGFGPAIKAMKGVPKPALRTRLAK
jgi:hypothetical protein